MVFFDKLLKIEEVSRVLKVNKRTVYRWIITKRLKATRLGPKSYRVFRSDLEKFIKKNYI